MCKEAIDRALAGYSGPSPEAWLYRGVWEEWPVHQANVLVPMSEPGYSDMEADVVERDSQRVDNPAVPTSALGGESRERSPETTVPAKGKT